MLGSTAQGSSDQAVAPELLDEGLGGEDVDAVRRPARARFQANDDTASQVEVVIQFRRRDPEQLVADGPPAQEIGGAPPDPGRAP